MWHDGKKYSVLQNIAVHKEKIELILNWEFECVDMEIQKQFVDAYERHRKSKYDFVCEPWLIHRHQTK